MTCKDCIETRQQLNDMIAQHQRFQIKLMINQRKMLDLILEDFNECKKIKGGKDSKRSDIGKKDTKG